MAEHRDFGLPMRQPEGIDLGSTLRGPTGTDAMTTNPIGASAGSRGTTSGYGFTGQPSQNFGGSCGMSNQGITLQPPPISGVQAGIPSCGTAGQPPTNAGVCGGISPDQRVAAQPTLAAYEAAGNFPPGLSMPEGVVDQPLSTQDLSLLVKFLATLGDLPKLDLGPTHDRAERLQIWKHAVKMLLQTIRPVVVEWWM